VRTQLESENTTLRGQVEALLAEKSRWQSSANSGGGGGGGGSGGGGGGGGGTPDVLLLKKIIDKLESDLLSERNKHQRASVTVSIPFQHALTTMT
jgi:hypothetical protein